MNHLCVGSNPNAGDLRGFDVAQAFQPAIQLTETTAGWKARPTLEIQDRTLKSQALGSNPGPGAEVKFGGAANRRHAARVHALLISMGSTWYL
jgi:hypothetical protein